MHKLRDAPGETEANLKSQLEDFAGKRRVYVLGLGNTDRADDGAGILVAESLKKLFPSYSFSEYDGIEGVVLDISEKKEHSAVFIIDAAGIKKEPGAVLLVRKEDIKETEITTHRVAVALMASILDKAKKETAVICIQPARVDFRGDVSQEVRCSVNMVARILSEIMEPRD